MPDLLSTSDRSLELLERLIRVAEHPGNKHREELALQAGMHTRPIAKLRLLRIEYLEALSELRQRRLEFSLEEQRQADGDITTHQMGRIAKPSRHAQRVLGEMQRFLHLEQIQMVDLQTSERGEHPVVIPELFTELPRPRIGAADIGVVGDPCRDQGGTKRHLQIQLALSPLALIGERIDQSEALVELADRFDVRRLPRGGHAGPKPICDRRRRTVRFRVVMRH